MQAMPPNGDRQNYCFPAKCHSPKPHDSTGLRFFSIRRSVPSHRPYGDTPKQETHKNGDVTPSVSAFFSYLCGKLTAGGPYRDTDGLFWHDSPPEEKRVHQRRNNRNGLPPPLYAQQSL